MFNKGKGAGSTKREVFTKGKSGRGPLAKRKVIMSTGEGLASYLEREQHKVKLGLGLAVPTKNLNNRKVTASTENMTLDARFTIASELRRQATDRQNQGRDALLAKKRGASAAAPEQPAKKSGAVQKGTQLVKRRQKAKGVALPGRVKVRPTAPAREAARPKGKRRTRGGKGRSGCTAAAAATLND